MQLRISFPKYPLAPAIVTLGVFCMGTLREAKAEPPTTQKHILVMVVASNDPAESTWASAVAEALAERIEDIGVTVKVVSIDAAPSDPTARITAARQARKSDPPLGGFTLDKSEAGMRFHLVLFDPKTEWSVERRLDEVDTPTVIETLAVILRTSLTVFMTDLEKRTVDAKSAPAYSLAPNPPETPAKADGLPDSRFYRAALGVGYDLSIVASELSPIHGVLFEGAVFVNRPVGLYTGYVVSFPAKREDGETSFKSVHHPVQIGVSLRTARPRFNVSGRVGFGINYVVNERSVGGDGADFLEKQGYLQLSVSPVLVFDFSIIDSLALFVAVGADILLRRLRYLLETNAAVEVIAEPWLGVPRISVGVSWRFFSVE